MSDNRYIRLRGASQAEALLTWLQEETESGTGFAHLFTVNLHCQCEQALIQGEVTVNSPGFLKVSFAENCEFDSPLEGFEAGLEAFLAIVDNPWDSVRLSVFDPAHDLGRCAA